MGRQQMVGTAVDWAGVREQVSALRQAPFREKVFGARGHRFLLEPPLREAEVAAAEEELGVSLPAAYRGFLLEVGAGGAGPHYGVFPLRHDAQGWHWVDDNGHRRVDAHLSQPFPSMQERARWAKELEDSEPQEQDFADDASFRAAIRAWDDAWDRVSDAMTAGAVRLGHQGCGYYTWLAVNGPDRDTLWDDLRAADGLLEPVGRPDRVDFHGWYTDWLTRARSQAYGA